MAKSALLWRSVAMSLVGYLGNKNLRQGKNNALEAVDEDMASQFETDSMYDDDDFDNIPGRVIEHKWRPCRFKNATFCMVCGKLTSSLGECPEEIPADSFILKKGPGVSRTGLRCQVCLMNIHSDCLERSKESSIAHTCTGRPDPRSGQSHFIREGIGNFNFSRHLSICEPKSAHRDSIVSQMDNMALENIDDSYKVLKQGKALRLVNTGEDIRAGKSAKNSIADPVFWKSLFSSKRGSIAPDPLDAIRRPKKGLFGGLMGSRNYKVPKNHDKEPYCALYDFKPRDKMDISLRPGDKIYVCDSKDDNWWFGKKEPSGAVGFFPAKFVMKVEETEKPFIVTKHCYGNSKRKELKAKENTIVVVNFASPINREDSLFVRSLDGEGFVPKNSIRSL
ncbi:Oidioi.mRNA.OKI2018_I69.XSR.g14459.t2.cds [Oikopleura dioica]|uniref:Oidioi.mRNA.OKI2018_I69.XSR.g14459.t2.cds n=1 Tax=Oikopleura dioica TaxID=34765 RepID=A0ABN7SAC6_OIKDI|nr:Oidioi.mRNA.OKI2018_I69.XSR.g14459.t2.cds [Oikopleura dioica]